MLAGVLRDNLCTDCDTNVSKCSQCSKCNLVCPKFDPICQKLKRAPFVCNGCESFPNCKREKHVYDPDEAEKMYKSNLSLKRTESALNSQFVQLIDSQIILIFPILTSTFLILISTADITVELTLGI